MILVRVSSVVFVIHSNAIVVEVRPGFYAVNGERRMFPFSFNSPPLTKQMSASIVFNDLDIVERLPFLMRTTRELASFRAINKTCDQAGSDPLKYHTIKCTLDNNDLWRRLIDVPKLASCVRCVEIVPSHNAWDTMPIPNIIVPPTIQAFPRPTTPEIPDSIDECLLERTRFSERLLIHAIRRMRNLEHFDWDAYPPLVMPVMSNNKNPTHDVWSAVREIKSLRSFRCVDLTSDYYVEEWLRMASPLLVTSGVRTPTCFWASP